VREKRKVNTEKLSSIGKQFGGIRGVSSGEEKEGTVGRTEKWL